MRAKSSRWENVRLFERVSALTRILCILLLLIASSSAQAQSNDNGEKREKPAVPASNAAASTTSPAAAKMKASAQRNENVPVYQLDTNAQQELNKRMGTTPQLVSEMKIESGYFASELGNSPSNPLELRFKKAAERWHGTLSWNHENSALNARTFFQVGKVQPSRQNDYGVTMSGPAGWLGLLTLEASQQKVRGMVNGNVLVPTVSEREPLAADPQVRAVVQRFLNAYPDELPNREDFGERALNTNSPQWIDATTTNLRLDRELSATKNLTASYRVSRQRVDAFQFVAGQNPDTEIHGHQGRLTHRWTLSDTSQLELGMRIQRTKSVLQLEPHAVGPMIRVGYQIQELGPDSEFPVNRALNNFTWGGLYSRLSSSGKHNLKMGGHLTRVQLNSFESNDTRGVFSFTNQFGRTAVENLLYGTPSKYTVTLGDVYRGYRNWQGQFFIGDEWRAHPRLTLVYGLRYGFEGRPSEVQGRDLLPYGCDCNNLSPRLGLAFRWTDTAVLRASYSIAYGEIFPVTYQQVRNNPPLVRQFQVQGPDLLNPLEAIDVNDPNVRYSPTVFDPNLSTPYSHQYSLVLERSLSRGVMLRLGYIGHRTIKLFRVSVLNRAEHIPGIPITGGTVDARRLDQRYYEVYNIGNGGIAYLDAAQVSLSVPDWKRLSLNASYTCSKSIDTGNDYTSTGANKDVTRGREQWQYVSFADRKGLSNFDSPHAFVMFGAYRIPNTAAGEGFIGKLVNDWTISATAMAKNGTPFTLYVGSDAPGFGNVDGSGGDRPNILDPSILGASFSHPDTSSEVLRRDRFAYIGEGDIRGNVGRNTFRKGPIKNINLALSKRWTLSAGGEPQVTFRIEANNLTNSPQFDEPGRNLTSPAFGQITNTLNQGRVIQASLQLVF